MATQSLAADLAPVAHSANVMVDPPPIPSSEHLLPDQLLVRLRTALVRKASLPRAPAGQIDEQVQSMGVRRREPVA